MKRYTHYILLIFILISCNSNTKIPQTNNNSEPTNYNFTIAFGSCNNQVLPNTFWSEILKNKPDVWVWGGDIVYSDTDDMDFLRKNFEKQKNNADYQNFIQNIPVLGTWDDHDFGLNDGGTEYAMKREAQQILLDFLDVPTSDERRKRDGVYFAQNFETDNGNVNIIVLDTRFFRSALTPDNETKKRYKPNAFGEGTMLGSQQWTWLEEQLVNSNAQFNVIVSSIQFLAGEHGFETWQNMPHEVEKLEKLLIKTKAKNTIILSGDRHISEFSKKSVENLPYDLIDFTSSGLTHSYTGFKSEPNKYRVGNVVSEKSFGIVKFNFNTNQVIFEMRGNNNALQESLSYTFN